MGKKGIAFKKNLISGAFLDNYFNNMFLSSGNGNRFCFHANLGKPFFSIKGDEILNVLFQPFFIEAIHFPRQKGGDPYLQAEFEPGTGKMGVSCEFNAFDSDARFYLFCFGRCCAKGQCQGEKDQHQGDLFHSNSRRYFSSPPNFPWESWKPETLKLSDIR